MAKKKYEPCRNFRRVVWKRQEIKGRDISVGADGSVWVLGTEKTEKGYPVKRWTGQGWEVLDQYAVRIAVDPKGNPWVIQETGEIYFYKDGKFKLIPSKARDISVGKEGTVYSIGWDKRKKGYPVYKWTGAAWASTSGFGNRIAVDNKGKPWVVTAKHKIYR